MAHEFGHGTGGLADEYCASRARTPVASPARSTSRSNSNRATLKWRQFVNPARPSPPASPRPGHGATRAGAKAQPGWDDSQNVGLFEGGGTVDSGIYRPVDQLPDARQLAAVLPGLLHADEDAGTTVRPAHASTKVYTGDFNGDGKDDILVHNGNSILIYRSNGIAARPRVQRGRAGAGLVAVPAAATSSTSATSTATARTRSSCTTATNWAMEYLGLLADDGSGGPAADRPVRRLDAGLAVPEARPLLRGGLRRRRARRPVRLSTGRTGPTPTSACSGRSGTGFTLVRALRRDDARLADEARRPALRRRLRRATEGGPLGVQRLGLVHTRTWGMLRSNGTVACRWRSATTASCPAGR